MFENLKIFVISEERGKENFFSPKGGELLKGTNRPH
jgi:hypothetical protein